MGFTSFFIDVKFGNFLSGQFFKVIIRVSFNLNFLTCDNFEFIFIDHLSFYVHIGVIIG